MNRQWCPESSVKPWQQLLRFWSQINNGASFSSNISSHLQLIAVFLLRELIDFRDYSIEWIISIPETISIVQ